MMVETHFKVARPWKPAVPKRINPKSAKARKADVIYTKNRAERLRLNPVCQRCTIVRASRTHHIDLRSGGVPDHSVENLLSCCENCHDEIHLAPADAYREGWMRRKHPRPGDAHFESEEE